MQNNSSTIPQWIVPILGVAFVAASAQLNIDLAWHDLQIPISGQSFAVLVTGMLLGRKYGLITILLYLMLGGLGLPFFANWSSGWAVFTKGTAGFLIGFALAAFIIGWLADLGWRKSFPKAFLAMFIGTGVIIGSGLLWLTYLYGWSKALEYGFYPFVWGALVKILLGAVVVYFVKYEL